jgi:hypothetical protein
LKKGGSQTWFWWEDQRETNLFEDPGVDGRITLRWILKKFGWGHGLD